MMKEGLFRLRQHALDRAAYHAYCRSYYTGVLTRPENCGVGQVTKAALSKKHQ